MANLSFKNSYVGVIVEDTAGTMQTQTIASSNNFATDVSFSVDTEIVNRNPLRKGEVMPMTPAVGSSVASMTANVEIVQKAASGTDAQVPDCDALLKSCGFARTQQSGAVGQIYTPAVPAVATRYSVSVNHDANQYNLSGALGSLSLSSEVGQPLTAACSWTGYASATNAYTAQAQVTPVYESNQAQTFINATCKLYGGSGGTTIDLQSFTFDMGAELVLPTSALDASGTLDRAYLNAFSPTLSLEGYAADHATRDELARQIAGTVNGVYIKLGTVDGTTIELETNNSIMSSFSTSDKNGVVGVSISMAMGSNDTAGSPPFTLTFS